MTAPKKNIHFLETEDGGVLFQEAQQRFYGLNATAALCWTAVSQGLPEPAASAQLVAAGAPEGEALAWWRASLTLFQAEGFLDTGPDADPDPAPAGRSEPELGQKLERIPPCVLHRHWRLFDVSVRAGFTDELLLLQVDNMFSALARPIEGPADLEIVVNEVGGRIMVARNGVVVGVAPDASGLAALLEPAILNAAIDATPYLLSLHAGVVGRAGRNLILPGPSGSGKTTLVAALAARGWSYGTDETALVASEGEDILTAPLSACIKESSWPLLAGHYPRLLDEPMQQRAGRRVRYLPPPGPVIERCRATDVVFPRRMEAPGETQLRPLGRCESLARLLAECVSVPRWLGASEARRLVDWANGLRFYELTFGALPDALDLLDGLESQGVPRQPAG